MSYRETEAGVVGGAAEALRHDASVALQALLDDRRHDLVIVPNAGPRNGAVHVVSYKRFISGFIPHVAVSTAIRSWVLLCQENPQVDKLYFAFATNASPAQAQRARLEEAGVTLLSDISTSAELTAHLRRWLVSPIPRS